MLKLRHWKTFLPAQVGGIFRNPELALKSVVCFIRKVQLKLLQLRGLLAARNLLFAP